MPENANGSDGAGLRRSSRRKGSAPVSYSKYFTSSGGEKNIEEEDCSEAGASSKADVEAENRSRRKRAPRAASRTKKKKKAQVYVADDDDDFVSEESETELCKTPPPQAIRSAGKVNNWRSALCLKPEHAARPITVAPRSICVPRSVLKARVRARASSLL